MSKRLPLLPKKRDAFTAIKRFMCHQDITLKVEEEAIRDRWFFCNALLRAKEDNEEAVIKKIVDTFGVSIFTARNDIQHTQRLFVEVQNINKKYLIFHHLQRIDEDIQTMRKSLFRVEVGKDGKSIQRVPDAKELAAYSKLQETYTYTLNSIPEEIQVDKQPPPIFQFLLAPGQVIDRPMLIEDALQQADEIILKKNPDGVYEMEADDEEE